MNPKAPDDIQLTFSKQSWKKIFFFSAFKK